MNFAAIVLWTLVGSCLFMAVETWATVTRNRPRSATTVLRENWIHLCFGGLFGGIMAGNLRGVSPMLD